MIDLGIWLPIFGGWLRNVEDEGMPPTFDYNKQVAQAADQHGFSTILIAELNLNDIKGIEAPSLECWTTTAGLAPVTENIRLMAALRPGFRSPAVAAKMAANIDHMSNGRFEINLVSGWWEEEMKMYAGEWIEHDSRYERSREFVDIMRGVWTEDRFSHDGEFYTVENTVLAPKPVQDGGIPLYAGGGSEAGRTFIAEQCDHYLMHGGSVDKIAGDIEDLRERRAQAGHNPDAMQFGMAAYMICRETEAEAQAELERITTVDYEAEGFDSYDDFVANSELDSEVDLKDYSVSNRGLRPNLVGTPDQIVERLNAYADVGLDLVIVQCSPMLEEVERIGQEVIPRLKNVAAA
ncbi:alkanesulfonate monooxygenase [Longimonas halophila]|uniref:Alkanesulfonate monooxygenase n=1 Tax=Longimonas halophila TaxID=1469170 RepID=A0A2H3NKL5_9BACT|nr:LLM class flavin-dependent oxidoreductase [Longimonas halophila]PEN06256.1 alkanesulfonate monooxygenase [Longimonas halophila]